MNKYIRLNIKNVSGISGTEEMGVIVLLDEEEERQLSITCDRNMTYQFSLRINNIGNTQKLLPEVLVNKLLYSASYRFEIIIDSVKDGQYVVFLEDIDSMERMPVRASDAMLLAYISDIPIYITEELMNQQSTKYSPNAKGLALPVNTLSNSMLRRALDKAVADENYELASKLKEEVDSRKKGSTE